MITPIRFGRWRYDGRTDWADRADTNGFFLLSFRRNLLRWEFPTE
jgi:hypothetical protein